MTEITLRANAKVNLALDVVGRREDGYHLMDMVNLSVSLHDTVTLTKNDGHGIRLIDGMVGVPDKKNLAYRAAAALAHEVGRDEFPVDIRLDKNIPSRAGLGGGSADAAAVLRGLVRLFSLPVREDALLRIGLSLGADVPFCLVGGAMRTGGIGELLTPLQVGCPLYLAILMPPDGISTAEAFARIDAANDYPRPDVAGVANALEAGDLEELSARVGNGFHEAFPTDTTDRLRAHLAACGACGSSMTGTGAAVFGLFRDAQTAKRVVGIPGQFEAFFAHNRPAGVEVLYEG